MHIICCFFEAHLWSCCSLHLQIIVIIFVQSNLMNCWHEYWYCLADFSCGISCVFFFFVFVYCCKLWCKHHVLTWKLTNAAGQILKCKHLCWSVSHFTMFIKSVPFCKVPVFVICNVYIVPYFLSDCFWFS